MLKGMGILEFYTKISFSVTSIDVNSTILKPGTVSAVYVIIKHYIFNTCLSY